MLKLWFFLTIILDVYPWVWLQFLPFRRRLRFPVPATAALLVGLMLPYQLSLLWVGMQSWCSLEILTACRMGQYLLLTGLALWLIRDRVPKILFVGGMVMPITVFVLTLASWIRMQIPLEAPLYMITSLLRLGLSAVLYPILLRLWTWRLTPAVELDGPLWDYSWPLPVAVTCITVLSTNSGVEVYDVTFPELLIRLCLLVAVFVMAVMMIHIAHRTEQRIRMEEEMERNRMLISAQKDQYSAMAAGILKTRRDCIQLRDRLMELQTLTRENKPEEARACIARLMEQVDREQPRILDQTAGEILGHYMALAEQEDIPVSLEAKIPEDLDIDGMDLGILLGNLFENAIEASRELPKEQRKIEITASRRRGVLRVRFRNRYAGEIRQINGRILSRKYNFTQPGVGLSTVWAVADKYGGELRIEHAKGVFTVDASLPEADEGPEQP